MSPRARTIRLVLFALGGLSIQCPTGCITTEMHALWHAPAEAEYYAISPVPARGGAPRVVKAIVVSYTASTGDPMTFEVGIDAAGLPEKPFGYHGKSRAVADIEQAAREVRWSSTYKARKTASVPDPARQWTEGRTWFIRHETYVITAYQVGPHGKLVPLPDLRKWAEDPDYVEIPEGYQILILPSKVDRPTSDVATERTLLGIATAFTLAVDTAIFPVELFFVFTGLVQR